MSGSDLAARPAVISLSAALTGVEFTILDGTFRQVARSVGKLRVELEAGIYEVSTRAGGRVQTELVSLEPGEVWERHGISTDVDSAAPLAGSRSVRTGHAEAAAAASRAVAEMSGPSAGLVVVVRSVAGSTAELHHRQLSLLDEHLHAVPGWDTSWQVQDSIATCGIRLEPGGYVLRLKPPAGNGPSLDQSVWLSAGWQTLLFCPNGAQVAALEDASAHMTQLSEPFLPEAYDAGAALEIALSGLRQGRPLVGSDLLQLLLHGEPVNLMLGIVGAHALLLDPKPDLGLFAMVTKRLLQVVPDHPDVQALAARVPAAGLPDRKPTTWPPMLTASYDLLLKADRTDPDVILDGSTAERVAGYVVQRGPWLAWEATEAVLPPVPLPEVPVGPRDIGSIRGAPTSRPTSSATSRPMSSTTSGATRRVQRHVQEVAQLTGQSQHQAANSLGVEELGRRLDLPAQTVRTVLGELGWLDVVVWLKDRSGERTVVHDPDEDMIAADVRQLREPPPEPPEKDDLDIVPWPAVAAAGPSWSSWRPLRWFVAGLLLATLVAVVVTVVRGAGGGPNPSPTVTRTVPGQVTGADVGVTLHSKPGTLLRTAPLVQLGATLAIDVHWVNPGTTHARGSIVIEVPEHFDLVKVDSGGRKACVAAGNRATCKIGITPGAHPPPFVLELVALRAGTGTLTATVSLDEDDVVPENDRAEATLVAR